MTQEIDLSFILHLASDHPIFSIQLGPEGFFFIIFLFLVNCTNLNYIDKKMMFLLVVSNTDHRAPFLTSVQ